MINTLVEQLPEVYQPIYLHPELSNQVSRACEDRLALIKKIYETLCANTGRPLKVLDIGCAQGYFSLNLAQLGAHVHGIDFLDANIRVCQALAKEAGLTNQVIFEVSRLQDFIPDIQAGEYDLVLGLSVFHHISHASGADYVRSLLSQLGDKCAVLLLELALRDEPLYWAAAQPEDPRHYLESFAFIHQLGEHSTHLSAINRPLFMVSNTCWILGDVYRKFDHWSTDPHSLAQGTHQQTRRYYWSDDAILKFYQLDTSGRHDRAEHNKNEYLKEIAALGKTINCFPMPRVISYGQSESYAWVAMERLPGTLLLEILRNKTPLNTHKLLLSLLKQLVALEAVGLWHNDVRTWNILVDDEGQAHLIDYGSISPIKKDCVWPENPILSFFILIREICTGIVEDPNPMRTIAISPYSLPDAYQAWAVHLWQQPAEQWTFASLYESLSRQDVYAKSQTTPSATDVWMSTIESALQNHKQILQNYRHRLHDMTSQQLSAQQAIGLVSDAHQHTTLLIQQLNELGQREKEHVAQHHQLMHIAKEAQEQTQTLIKQLHQADEIHVQLRHDLQHSQQELQRLHQANHHHWTQLTDAQQALSEAQQLHQQQLEQIAQHKQELAEVSLSNQQHAAQLLEAQQELATVHQANHHHWLALQQAQTLIQNMQSSWSWRLTAPIRAAVQVVLSPVEVLRSALNGTLRWTLVQFERPIGALIAGTLRHKGLSETLNQYLLRWPHLHQHLRIIAQRRQGVKPPVSLPSYVPKAAPAPAPVAPESPPGGSYSKRTRLLNPQIGKIYYYVDHTVQCPTNTGMQRVTRQLARAMLEQGSQLIFVKWDNALDRLVLVSTEDLAHLEQWGGPGLSETARTATSYLPNGSAPQVVEGQDFNDCDWLVVPEVTHINYHQRQLTLDVILAAKRAHLRTAFVFYDAIPLRRAELAGMSSGHEAYMRQLLQADLILPISKWSGQDLQDFLMTHEGVAQDSLPNIQALLLPAQVPGQDRVQNQHADMCPPNKKQILCVGSIDERKNQIALAHAFNHLAQQGLTGDWQLIFIGNLDPALSEELQFLITASRNSISWLGNCSDEELKKQYQECSFTVFPSVEEGFGLPVAESLWLGKPCLCANFGPMAEVAEGGGCLTANMHQRSAIEEGLKKLMHDTVLRDKLSHEAATRNLQDWLTYGRAFTAAMQAKVTPATQLPVVYYLVDHTASFDNNTGIQRVVRCLAAGLLKQGIRLIPAKWSADKTTLIKISDLEREHLARWNGPSEQAWCDWSDPTLNQGAWLLMPELTPHFQNKDYTSIRRFLDLHGMQAGVIFYDTIPWKLQDIYSPEATQGHRTYMEGLNKFELILPISNYSREQLAFFYQGEQIDTSGQASRLRTCPLPGEFLETTRTLNIKPRHSDTIEVLSVGTLESRKNHLTLVEAFLRAATISRRPMRLTLAGGGPVPAIAEKIQQLARQHPTSLRWIASPSDTVLNELYEACDFTVYPSYEEGFGLPILESLWHARPCICMDQGAMAEVAVGGGCLMVDTCDADALAQLLVQLSENDALRLQLVQQAIERPFRTWDDYAQDCAWLMVETQGHKAAALNKQTKALPWHDLQAHMPNLQARPLLSVCISTYNRAKWLSLSLPVLIREAEQWRDHIEVFVCDNTSTDTTPDVVAPYVAQGLVRYHRNPKNLGMLGNLRSTAQEARGQYIWILGDDDIVKPGSVGRVVQTLQQHPDLALVYLNYAYTRDDSPKDIAQLPDFFAAATPVVPACPDQLASIKELAVLNENFFTAIYCLVFQRAHALLAYSQFTEGEPFSKLPTCVPTTNHVLHHMMDLKGYWLGEPQLVVNLNVSWMRYAWRWILERFPEMHDLAIKNGSDRRQVDRWRAHHLPGIVHFLTEIYGVNSADPVRVGFDMAYLISQIKHLNEYPAHQSEISRIYGDAFSAGHPLAKRNPDTIFINN